MQLREHVNSLIYVYTFVCCCLATRFYHIFGSLLRVKGWVWLTCKMGQLRNEVNSKQISYMTLIGVHSTMHLMHSN